jgi:hypothetical protein
VTADAGSDDVSSDDVPPNYTGAGDLVAESPSSGVPVPYVGPISSSEPRDAGQSTSGPGTTGFGADDLDTAVGATEVGGGRRTRRVVGIVAVVLVVAIAAVAGAVAIGTVVRGGSSTTGSAAARAEATHLLHESLTAAEEAETFHYESTSTAAGATQLTIGDAAPNRGSQVITIGPHTFDIVVVDTEAFFKGDATVLQSQLGLDQVAAQQYAGQWISLQPSDAPYQSVYTAVNTSSALADGITITPRRVLSASHDDGVAVTSIRGGLAPTDQTPASGVAQLDVRVSSHLPVRFSSAGAVGGLRTVVHVNFSDWGETVTVTAPTGAVPYSSLPVGGIAPQPGNPPILT